MDLLKASRLILLATTLMAAASSRGASSRTTVVAIKDRANANASLAATGQFVGLVWAGRTKEGVTDIYVATSRDGGGTFAAATRISREAGEASVSGEQPPRIALVTAGSQTRYNFYTECCSSSIQRSRLRTKRSTGSTSLKPRRFGLTPIDWRLQLEVWMNPDIR